MSMMLLKCCLSLSFAASIVIGCLLQWVNLSLNSPWVILKLIHFLPFYSFLFFLCLIPIPTVFLPSNIYPAQMKPPQEKEREEDLFFFLEFFCFSYSYSSNSILLILDRVVILNNLNWELKKAFSLFNKLDLSSNVCLGRRTNDEMYCNLSCEVHVSH